MARSAREAEQGPEAVESETNRPRVMASALPGRNHSTVPGHCSTGRRSSAGGTGGKANSHYRGTPVFRFPSLLGSPPMQRFRHHSAPAAWLALVVIVLGGGLVATHSHDGHPSGKLGSVALSGGHVLPDTTALVASATSIRVELCPACVAGQRQGALDASHSTSRSLVMVSGDVRAAISPAISGSDALPPSPRGPPTI